jgi:hypothetical protein
LSINIVLLDGEVKSPALRYGADGKPEYRFTLVQQEHTTDGRTIQLYWPCCALAAAAERLAGDIEDGQHIVITNGKLCYRKRSTKLGEQSRMEVLVWSCERLTTSPQAARSATGEGGEQGDEPTRVPEPSKKRHRYPKWKPSAVVEPN